MIDSRPTSYPVLPDMLRPGLDIVFCGTAAGNASAALRAYYAGRGNRFWSVLHETGLTRAACPLKPDEWRLLDGFGIGLTDLCKSLHGMDSDLPTGAFDVARLRAAIEGCAPKALAFNGRTAAQAFLGRAVKPGLQPETAGTTAIWALPSTSGAARGHWDSDPWLNLARSIGKAPVEGKAARTDGYAGTAGERRRGPK